MAVEYLSGSLVAEFTHRLDATGSQRGASLAPRTLNDYLPSYAARLLRGTGACGGILLALFIWGPRSRAEGMVVYEASALAGGTLVMLLPLFVELLLRRMVARPQPVASRDVAATDDAIRASSIHAVAAAGICATMLLAATFSAAVSMVSFQPLRWILAAAAVAFFITGGAVWFRLGSATTWRVRRNIGPAGLEA